MKLISVTQALSPFNDFSMIHPDVLAHAAARGTLVHNALHAYVKKLWLRYPATQETIGYIKSGQSWINKYVREIIVAEHEIINETHRIVGHIDLICILTDYSVVVVDWKTPITEGKTWRLQLAGYLWLAQEYQPSRAMALQLFKDGRMARAIDYQSDPRDLQCFLAAAGVYHYILGG